MLPGNDVCRLKVVMAYYMTEEYKEVKITRRSECILTDITDFQRLYLKANHSYGNYFLV